MVSLCFLLPPNVSSKKKKFTLYYPLPLPLYVSCFVTRISNKKNMPQCTAVYEPKNKRKFDCIFDCLDELNTACVFFISVISRCTHLMFAKK